MAHSKWKTTVTVSPSQLSASLIDAHATTSSLTDCWMNISLTDVTDDWLDVPAPLQPQLFHTAEFRQNNEYSPELPTPRDWLQTF